MPDCTYPDSWRYKPMVLKKGGINFAFSRKNDPKNDVMITIPVEDAIRFSKDLKKLVKEIDQ